MRQYTLLQSKKQTENKLRWNAAIEGANFAFYIPKRRVPTPWPSQIKVMIDENVNHAMTTNSSADLITPIRCIVKKCHHLAWTVRYRPIPDQPEEWEIGEPYIPNKLLSNPAPEYVYIEVHWDYSAGTWTEE